MSATPTTKQGRATRERIVWAAAELIAERGATGITLDDVRAATGASKSQLYHYFGDKHGLVEAVVEHQCASVLGFQARALAAVTDWERLERWKELMVTGVEQRGGRGGCPIGTLAAALADTDDALRINLNDAFRAWSDAIRGALARLRDNGLIAPETDLDRLTTIMLSATEGGLLLAKASRNADPLRTSLDAAIAQFRASAPNRRRLSSQTPGG